MPIMEGRPYSERFTVFVLIILMMLCFMVGCAYLFEYLGKLFLQGLQYYMGSIRG